MKKKFIYFSLFFSIHMVNTKTIIIGHRGAAGIIAENTLASFEYAIVHGVDMVECDVWRCASGELVVIHDRLVNRTTNGTGNVKELTLKQLKKLSINGS